MGSPDHTWWNGLYPLSRNFYSRFLPQVEAVAGDAGRALIEQHVRSRPEHGWLGEEGEGSAALGYGMSPGAK